MKKILFKPFQPVTLLLFILFFLSFAGNLSADDKTKLFVFDAFQVMNDNSKPASTKTEVILSENSNRGFIKFVFNKGTADQFESEFDLEKDVEFTYRNDTLYKVKFIEKKREWSFSGNS